MWIDPLSRRFLKSAGEIPAGEGRGPVVLMYHSITPGNGKPHSKWSISENRFVAQLDLLKSESWTTVCVRDLLRADILPPRTVVLTFDDGFADNFEHGFRHLSDRGMKATWFVVTNDIGLYSSWTDEDAPVRPILTVEQLQEMAGAGMEIGCHTRTHARLTDLDAVSILDEVAGSREDLESLLFLPMTSFAYPYGLLNEECVQAVRQAGFSVACTTRTGWFGSGTNLFEVRRVAVFANDTLSAFARKLAFADTNVSWDRMAAYIAARAGNRLGI